MASCSPSHLVTTSETHACTCECTHVLRKKGTEVVLFLRKSEHCPRQKVQKRLVNLSNAKREDLVCHRKTASEASRKCYMMQLGLATCVPNHICRIETAMRAPTGLLDACKLPCIAVDARYRA